MIFDIVSKIRFGLSLIALWFRLIFAEIQKKRMSEEAYFFKILSIAKKHTRKIIAVTRMDLVVEGLENIPDEPVVYMGNHQSYIDIYVTVNALQRKLCLIGKKEIEKIPIVAYLAREMSVLFLDRENSREGLKTILEAIRRMKEERFDVLIYPEGTRSKRLEMGEFHKGSFKIPQKAHAPIIPMVVNNAYRVFEDNYRVTPHIPVRLAFLPPVHLEELSEEEAKNIDELVKGQIAEKLKEFNK